MAIISFLGTIAAATAAVAALIGLRYARQSARAGREAAIIGRESAQIANATMQLAEQSRRETERDRERQRLRHIGELVERLFWVASLVPADTVDDEFRATMNLLTQALVGRDESLPECSRVLQAANAGYVKGLASGARLEVRQRLQELETGNATASE